MHASRYAQGGIHMEEKATAPECIVVDCDRLSALTDRASGKLLSVDAYFCADCYMAILGGEHLRIDPARLVVSFREPCPGRSD
jgi:hypothetical protein